MSDRIAMSSLLSKFLVAYTIECDTEFEHHLPHRTAIQGRGVGTGPWLISMAMWANFLRYLPLDGATRGELEPLSQMVNLGGLQRWGYVHIEPTSGGRRDDDLVRPSPAGLRTQAAWPRIVDAVDARWAARFGGDVIAELRACLDNLSDRTWPDYLPVVGYGDGMRAHVPNDADFAAATRGIDPAANLSAGLSRVLLAFTLAYEQRTRLSLTMLADVLRVIGNDGVRLRDLPAAGGVSKEGIAAAVGFLQRHDLAMVTTEPGSSRAKFVTLTDRGRRGLDGHHERLVATERDWRARFGDGPVDRLRQVCAQLRADTDSDGRPLLAAGLIPYPQCWRAQRPYLAQTQHRLADPWGALPHHPMVLHRGGYPDGC